MRKNRSNTRFYEKEWVIILCGVVCFPLALFFLLLNRKVKPFVKVIIALMLLFIWIIGVYNIEREYSGERKEDTEISFYNENTETIYKDDKEEYKDVVQGNNSDKKTETTKENEDDKKAPLEVIKHSAEADEYFRYAVGEVKNNSDKTYSYIQISIGLYNEEGNKVGSTVCNINNLEPGKVGKYKAIITEDEANQIKIEGINGV